MTHQPPPYIAAFDLATLTGVCDGIAGGGPRFWTWDLNDGGPFRAQRFAMFEALVHNYLTGQAKIGHPVQRVFYEAPQPIQVMARLGTEDGTIAMLRGLVAILELQCFKKRITCESFQVQKAREMVCGKRIFPSIKRTIIGRDGKPKVVKRSGAKPAVMEACRFLGHDVQNDNEADAVVGWLYESALLKPHFSTSLLPLFSKGA